MIHQTLLLIGQAVSHQTLTPIKSVGGGLLPIAVNQSM
jgi:hypothetical protein